MSDKYDDSWLSEVEDFANAADDQDTAFTTGSRGLLEAAGLPLIASGFVVTALLLGLVTLGLKLIRPRRR